MDEIKVETVEAEVINDKKVDYVQKAKDALKKGISTVKTETLNVVHWAKDNKEDAAILTGALLGGLKLLRTMRGDKTAKQKDFEDRQKRYYDAQHGQWFDLKREMKTREKIELEERIDSGESAGRVLKSMGLLKY